jgi:hypothetical protein
MDSAQGRKEAAEEKVTLADPAPPETARRSLLIVATLVASWMGMQAVHETGHVLGALATGGKVKRVVLHPLAISRTDLADNPKPLFVVWAGPVFGVLAPLALWGVAASARIRGAFVARFFAGFCLVANGLYIGVGSFGRIGDCNEMLQHGSGIGSLRLFGATATIAGFALWNRQGRHFGLGANAERIEVRVVVAAALAAALIVSLGIFVGGN